MDIFETKREFENTFPNKIYICPKCEVMTGNPNICPNCGNQSTNFIYQDKAYTYHIKDINETKTIFTPIERINNENKNN